MELLITELVLDSEREENVPLYNFIEVYNNTDRPISLKDLDIRLRYTGRPEFDRVWHPEADDVLVGPGQPIVFWMMNPFNERKTVADFNAKYGCELVENRDIVRLPGEMMNTKQRTVVVSTKAGIEAALADYNANSYDVAYEKSLLYRAPENGGVQMKLFSCKEEVPTPGKVSADQIPSKLVKVGESAPAICDLTCQDALRPGCPLEFVAEMASDTLITYFSFFYKDNRQNTFTRIELQAGRDDGRYRYTVEAPFLLGCSSVTYYFAASNGHRETVSEPVTVGMVGEQVGVRLSVNDGEVLAGEVVVVAAIDGVEATGGSVPGNGSFSPDASGVQLLIDGREPEGVFRCLDHPLFFVFEVAGIHRVFKNAVMLGDEIIKVLNYNKVEFDFNTANPILNIDYYYKYYYKKISLDFDTVVVPIDPVKLRLNDYTVSVRAGSLDKVIEDRDGVASDKFAVRNARLVLPDGTVIRDRLFSGSSEEIKLDGREGGPVQVDFSFEVPTEHLTAKAVVWDTTAVAEGPHRISAFVPGQGETFVNVLVDNSGSAQVIPTAAADQSHEAGKAPFGQGGNSFHSDNLRVFKHEVPLESPEAKDFTFVLMPDTQTYTMLNPQYLDVQVNWIKENAEAMNIRYVAHVGDLVEMSEVEHQWQNADRSMRILDEAGIPYGVVTGNHDTGCGHQISELNYAPFSQYFGEWRFKGKKHYGGSYLDNRGHYDLISASGIDFIIVYMGYTYSKLMPEEEIVWINEVLAAHRDRKAILVVHEYLRNDGELAAKGKYIFKRVVVPNPNVIMTMNGHFHGCALRVDELDDDGDGVAERKVNQLSGTKGTSTGFMTLLHFDIANQKVYARPYSPVLDKYNSALEFTFDMDLTPSAEVGLS